MSFASPLQAQPLPLQQQQGNMLASHHFKSASESAKNSPAQLQKTMVSAKPSRTHRHRGNSSVSIITGKTAVRAAQEAAARRHPQPYRRSQSPPVKNGMDALSTRLASSIQQSGAQPTSSSGDVTFRLPLVLPRPKQTPLVNTDALKEMDPSLLGVSLPLVKDILTARTEGMLRGLASVDIKTARLPPTGMPTEIPLKISSSYTAQTASLPTHLLCVINPTTSHGQLYPVHALVLGAHCARLPPFPVPADTDSAEAGASTTFPIVPITLPHAESFPIIFDYLYTKNFARFVSSLIPLPPSSTATTEDGKPLNPDQKFQRVVEALVQTYSMGALLEKMKFVHGVWSNVFKLGISEEGVWKCMNTAWTALVRALVKAREQQVQQQQEKATV
ncbi:hypothetical protein FS837_004097 [Tulasnella sp. UAMH 9824]|nr:hypothetical protein FS837_004097 [Tulasnella sp. UAMH 9824]